MSVYALHPTFYGFPPVEEAEQDGLLAVGGDLAVGRLLNAYQAGIFPWYSHDEPILWWSPDPRFVLYPSQIKVSKSMKQVLKKNQFKVTLNKNFEDVITACKKVNRNGQLGTWITQDMLEAFVALHKAGYAHSVEVWNNKGELAGGLYGVAIGACFFGESMFTYQSNASKTAFIVLVKKLQSLGYQLIDCQVYTKHLESLGASMIERTVFIQQLKKFCTLSIPFNWSLPTNEQKTRFWV